MYLVSHFIAFENHHLLRHIFLSCLGEPWRVWVVQRHLERVWRVLGSVRPSVRTSTPSSTSPPPPIHPSPPHLGAQKERFLTCARDVREVHFVAQNAPEFRSEVTR